MSSSRAIRAGRAFVELFADDSKLIRGMKRAEWRVRKFGDFVAQTGRRMVAAGAIMATPLVGAIRAASNAQETLNKFEQVFGDQAGAAGAFADALAKSVGRSKYAIRDALATFQSFFVGLGLGGSDARELSQLIQSLALDFASFHNLEDQDAIGRFISALSGSGEVLDRFGINIKQAALQQELLRMGIRKTWGAVTEQEKAMARLNLIMRAMGDQGAIGDAERTAGSFENRMKALRATLHDAYVEIGMALLPVVTPLVARIKEASEAIGRWIARHHEAVVMMAKFAAGLVAGGVALMAFAALLKVTAVGIGVMAMALTALFSPIGLSIGAIVALGVVLAKFTKFGGKATAWLAERFGAMGEAVKLVFGGIRDALASGDWQLAAKVMWLGIKVAWRTGMKPLEEMWHNFIFGLQSAWEIFTHKIATIWTDLTFNLRKGWAEFSAWLKTFHSQVTDEIAKGMLAVMGLFDKDLDVKAAQEGVDESGLKDRRDIESERKSDLSDLDEEHTKALDNIEDEHTAKLTALTKENQAKIDTAQDALDLAREELRVALATVKAKKEALLDGNLAGPDFDVDVPDIKNMLGNVAATANVLVQGTFSSMNLGGMGMGNSRQMDKIEEHNRLIRQHTKATAEAVRMIAMVNGMF